MNSYHKAGIGESDTFSAHELAAGITQPRESQLDTERLPQPPGALFPALIFVLLATTICATGYATYIFGEQHIEQERFDDLQTIASLKTDHITHWLNERRGDAFLLGQQSVMAELFAHWLANGHHGDADHKTLTSRLAAIRQAYGYQNVALLDTNAEPVLSATSEQAHLSPQLKKLAQSAISQQRTLFSDLYRNESVPAQPVSFDIATPMTIQTSNGKNGLVGAIVFQIDPERDLYPMVKAWPTHELVAETLLVRREGDEVVVLSELRHQPGSALKMRKPLNQPGLKAALVSQAKATSFQGKDYSGTSVLAAFSPVPGTSWHLVAKINREAIYTPLRQIAFVSVALSLLLLTIAGIAVTAWWQRQRIRYEQNQTALAWKQNLLTQHIDYLSKYTNDIILLTDEAKRIIMANDTALKVYGYSRQELIGMDLHALRTAESSTALNKDYELTLQHGHSTFEASHQRKNGTSFPVEVSARQIEADGKTIIQTIIRDITERKSSEKLLQEQMAEISTARQEWESVFDGVAEPIFLHDSELRIVRANHAYAKYANMAFKDIIGKPYWQVFPKLDGPLPGCPDRKISENEIRLDNGRIFISHNYPIAAQNAEQYIAVHVMEDITERERVIEEIRLKSHFLDASTDSIFIADLEGNLMDANETAWKTLGYSREELLSMSFHTLDTPNYAKLVDERIQLVLNHGKAVFETAHRCKDGSEIPVEVNGKVITSGKQKLLLGSARNITERKKTERRQRKEAEQTRMLLELHKMASQSTAQEIYDYALEKSARLTDSTIGYLHGLNNDQETLALITWNQEALKYCEASHDTHYPLSQAGIWADSIRQRHPVIHNDYQALPDRKGLPEGHVHLIRHLSLPVILEDQVRLIIGVGNKATDYDDEDITQLQLIANELVKIMARKQAEEGLAASESRYRSLMDSTTDYIYTVQVEDGKAINTSHGPGCVKITGYAPEDFAADTDLWLRMVYQDDAPTVVCQAEKATAGENAEPFEFRIHHKDGSLRWLSSTLVVRRDHEGKTIAYDACISDITPRKQAEHDLERLNRTLKTLSAGNMALVHAGNETEVLEQMCRTIVETGGYRLAWVGFAENDPEKSIHPVAYHGIEEGFLDTLPLTWDGTGSGLGPTCTAIRTGKTIIFQDLLNEPDFAPWRAAAQQRGFAASISLPLENSEGVFGALNIYAGEANAFTAGETKLLEEMAGDLAFGITGMRIRTERDHIAAENQQHMIRLRASLEDAIQAIAATVEMRDPYTAGHQRRVADLAVEIAREMGLEEEKIHGLHLAGIVHDLGKIHVPAEILSKPGKLTEIEFMLIQTHSQAGYDIIKGIAFPWPIADIVLQHHERLDGSGYPNKLRNEQILTEAKILAIADVVEAMASHRPYRPGLGIDLAMNEIEKHRGIFYDPEAADACLRLIREKGFTFRQV